MEAIEQYDLIKLLCKSRGTTLTRFFREKGLDRHALTRLKKGEIDSLSIKTLTTIAASFHVSMDKLTGIEHDLFPIRNAIEIKIGKGFQVKKQDGALYLVQEPWSDLSKSDITRIVKQYLFGTEEVSDEVLEAVRQEAQLMEIR